MPLRLVESETFADWFERLRDQRAKAIVSTRLQRLAGGRTGGARSVSEGVMELRIHFGPGYQVYFCRRGDEVVLLLCGGVKDSQLQDIARAIVISKEEDEGPW